MKVFLWRVCQNALATKANLFRWKISEDPLYPIYGVTPETSGHVLWSCPAASAVWGLCSSKIQKRSSYHEDFLLIMEDLFCFLDQEDMELVAAVAQLLWLHRNALVFGRLVTPIHLVMTNASESLMDFRRARSSLALAVVATLARDLRWKAPPIGFVKVN